MSDIEYSVLTSDVIKSFDCNMLQNALTQDKLQYLLARYPHPPSQKHSGQLYFVFIFYFQFRNFNKFSLSRHDGDSHTGHHASWKSLSYKLHRMRDYLLPLTSLVVARDLCILG